jgi:hypothetical protein
VQPAHFFDPFFLKVSVDQFSKNRYIPISNAQGGGVGISSFSGKKAWSKKETVVKYKQSEAPAHPVKTGRHGGACGARSGQQ